MLQIIAVGKKFDRDLTDAIQGYQQRLRAPFAVEWTLIQYSPKHGDEARRDESGRLLQHIHPDDYVILLDERGQQLTSPEFSAELVNHDSNAVLVIGGAYGVDDRLRQRANRLLALSRMVFPHQLVRLILMEQIYRAQAIYQHHPYHHE